MSDASPTRPSDGDERPQINVRVTPTFLEQIDDVWQGRGFNSRSEYIRHVLRDSVENPTFDRDELSALARAEREIRDGETYSREEIIDEFDLDTTTESSEEE
jgi:Arc/MetJ-type ribon-helix-helix transcriptional regulator